MIRRRGGRRRRRRKIKCTKNKYIGESNDNNIVYNNSKKNKDSLLEFFVF